MAIPKKNSRKIVVEDREYRWASNLKGGTGDLTITIQGEAGDGSLLIVKALNTDPYLRLSLGGDACLPPDELTTATPALVRAAILFGHSAGWEPESKGPPLALRYADEAFQLEG